jgi:DNA-binding NarL/FixJ family response regulator
VTEPVHQPFPDDVIRVPRLLLLGQLSNGDLLPKLVESEQVEFVGNASSADEALRLLVELHPDLVLVDLDDDGSRTDQSVSRIVAARTGVLVIGLTRDPAAPWVGQAIRDGLAAVVSLSEGGAEQLVAEVCVLAATLGARPGETPSSSGR